MDVLSNPGIERSNLIRVAKKIKAGRSARSKFLAPELFGEPAWDILLTLYIAEGEQYRMLTSKVCKEGGVPDTTALRWIDYLTALELVEKVRNPTDARSNYVTLTQEGVSRMDGVIESIREMLY